MSRSHGVHGASGKLGESRHDGGMDPDVAGLVAWTQEFVRDGVLPVDDRYDGDVAAAGGDNLRRLFATAHRNGGFWHRMHRSSSMIWVFR